VIYLLDVNALLALAHTGHTHHERTEAWVQTLRRSDRIATCAVTELGFVRIASQARLSPDVAAARELLVRFLIAGRANSSAYRMTSARIRFRVG
jgi:predicted nucleic acid-binding protein